MRIYLIGLPGVGKSTIGKHLAKKIGYTFIDLDNWIEQKALLFVDEIFHSYGEAYFRALETSTLKEASQLENVVISCGGGIVKTQENKDYILGPCIYIKAPLALIEERLKSSSIERPLLASKSLFELSKEREALYEEFATIEIENRELEETIQRIIERIEL